MYRPARKPPEQLIHTIGHSNHSLGTFLEMLQKHGIREVVDVRSTPFSRHVPHFNRERLETPLEEAGIAYRFMGETLGGRPQDACCYDEHGIVQYEIMAEDAGFQESISQIADQSRDWSLALMCTEADPMACHRTLLVAHAMRKTGTSVYHILRDGQREDHDETITRLLSLWGMPLGEQEDMKREQVIEQALRQQARKVGYRKPRTQRASA